MADLQPLIAVRIKDGIFVGNVTAAHDEDFLFMNKVTHIVNCAGGEVQDLFSDSGIQYMTFPWKDTPGVVNTTIMFDSADRNIEQAVRFIDKGLENGDCVLVHSYYGLSRSPALVAAYFMVKYGWKVDNALAFLKMAHQEMNIKPHFLRQLRMFAKRHEVGCDVFDLEVDDTTFALDNDQWMLRNTLLNGLNADVQSTNKLYADCAQRVEVPELVYKNPAKRRRRLSFVDTKQGTSVGSTASTPVVAAKPTPLHVDPFNSEGGLGYRSLRLGKPKEGIAARHGTPNPRPLESRPDVNAKGRQSLPLRSQSAPPTLAHQERNSHVSRQAYPEHPPIQPVIIQRGIGQSTVVDTASHSQQLQYQLQQDANARRASQPTATSTSNPPPATAAGTFIRSPFALTSHAPRNGSPLPLQRQAVRPSSSTASTVAAPAQSNIGSWPMSSSASGLRSAAQPPPPSVQDVKIQSSALPRASSPASQQANSTSGRRTSSPLARQTLTSTAPSMTAQLLAGRGSSPRGNPQQLTTAQPTSVSMRRPSSPVGRNPVQGYSSFPTAIPSTTSGAIQRPSQQPVAVYSSASTLQQQRALSPQNRSSLSALPRASSPMQKPSAVVARTSSPRPTNSPLPVQRTLSPMRSSLADQYLGIGGSGLPRTSTGPSAASSSTSTVLRRTQPTAVTARRM